MSKILEGVRVIDFTHMIAGPLCTMLLGDLGADVIKIEPAKGETSRQLGATYVGGQTDYFLAFNRNKRSIVLDLKTPQGIETAKALIASADVVVENFRVGTMDRLGLGYEALSAINPALVYCSVSGFGKDDDNPSRPAVDPIVQALSGIMQLTGTPESGPLKTGFPVGDYSAPLFATIGILAALYERQRTRKGQQIDISMFNATLFSMIPREGAYFIKGESPQLLGNAHSQVIPSNTYLTSDGRQIFIFVPSDKFWKALVSVLDDEMLATDPRFSTNKARLEVKDLLDQRIAAAFRKGTLAYWMQRLEEAGAIGAPVRTFEEVFSDPSVRRNMVAEVEHPSAGTISLLRAPIGMSDSPLQIRRPPPLLGEHTEEVLKEFNLRQDGVERQKAGQA